MRDIMTELGALGVEALICVVRPSAAGHPGNRFSRPELLQRGWTPPHSEIYRNTPAATALLRPLSVLLPVRLEDKPDIPLKPWNPSRVAIQARSPQRTLDP